MSRPPIRHMAKNFTMTMIEWARAGCPFRPKEEVRQIFDEQCRPCENYNPGRNILGKKGYCELCGCHVSDDVHDPLNKILDPLVSCPLDPPKWERRLE